LSKKPVSTWFAENEAYVLLAHDVARDAKTLFCITDSTLNMAIINVDAAEVIHNQVRLFFSLFFLQHFFVQCRIFYLLPVSPCHSRTVAHNAFLVAFSLRFRYPFTFNYTRYPFI
jgi:hypothetical protein